LYLELLSRDFHFAKGEIDSNYFNLLLENEIIFECDKKISKLFPPLNETTSMPYKLAIAVIEVTSLSMESSPKLFGKNFEEDCNIGQLNFVFSDYTDKESIIMLPKLLSKIEIDTIELTFLKDFKYMDLLFEKIQDFNLIIIINNFSDAVINNSNNTFNNRMFCDASIKSSKICTDLSTFFISKNHNPYYYNKMFIGRNSEIKNSYESSYVFGYLNEIEKLEIDTLLSDKEFTKYWSASKNNTLICNECEFRRLCNDNRLPIEIDNQKWSHKKECEYNPYISKWFDDNGYLNLSSSGIELINGDVKIKNKKLKDINFKLWGN